MERDLNCLCGRVLSQTDDTAMMKIFWMLPCTMITLNAGQKSIFLRIFQNIGLQVCWIYMCMVCKRNLSLVHGMWSQLIEATLCVISINGTHLSQPHTWGLNPIAIAFYKQTSDYCQGFPSVISAWNRYMIWHKKWDIHCFEVKHPSPKNLLDAKLYYLYFTHRYKIYATVQVLRRCYAHL